MHDEADGGARGASARLSAASKGRAALSTNPHHTITTDTNSQSRAKSSQS